MKHKMNTFIRDAVSLQRSLGT